ncbi:MAG: TIM barrel protein [Acidobacteriota bacterium]|nr:TIM barrel protein [Acidobacteriota bacterium]
MNRREFIGSAAWLAGAGATRTRGLHAAQGRQSPVFYNFHTLRRVGISSWSFRSFFPSTGGQSTHKPALAISLLDFPRLISDRYQVHRLEFSSLHFASTDAEYLRQLRSAMSRSGSRLVNIAVRSPELAAGAGLSDRDPEIRGRAVTAVKPWIDAARKAGAAAVSMIPGQINPADLSPAADSFRQLSAYGRLRRVQVLIENHRGTNPSLIAAIIHETPGRTLGALPDFANFTDAAARATGLGLLFSNARGLCHADGIKFDSQGNETAFDFRQCLAVARRSRFRGIYSVRFEGPGDPYEGVQNVVNELVRYL